MRPNIAKAVPKAVWTVFNDIRLLIEHLPETIESDAFMLGVRLSRDIATSHVIPNCHVIVRALAAVTPVVRAHQGYVLAFGANEEPRALEHSWCTVRGEDERFIIDAWPLGSVSGPALMVQDYAFHYGPEFSFLETRTEEFSAQLDATVRALRNLQRVWGDKLLACA